MVQPPHWSLTSRLAVFSTNFSSHVLVSCLVINKSLHAHPGPTQWESPSLPISLTNKQLPPPTIDSYDQPVQPKRSLRGKPPAYNLQWLLVPQRINWVLLQRIHKGLLWCGSNLLFLSMLAHQGHSVNWCMGWEAESQTPREVHILIPRTCEYVALNGKGDLVNVFEVMDLEMGRLSSIIQVGST